MTLPQREGLVQTGIRLPPDLYKRIQQRALDLGVTAQAFVAEGMDFYLGTEARLSRNRKKTAS